MEFLRPMLAAPLLKPDVEHTDKNILEAMSHLRYPVLASLKKDGIRGIMLGELASRTLNKIPNESIRQRAEKLPYGFDMELWNPSLAYDEVESIVMSQKHPKSELIQFHILDWWFNNDVCGYQQRINLASSHTCNEGYTDVVSPLANLWMLRTPQDLLEAFKQVEEERGEGICFRTPDSPYKQGRSTLREQYLVKLARYVRTECTIIGFVEQMFNGNDDRKNPIGLMKRRSLKGGLIGKSVLGAFQVRDANGLEFTVGTGIGLTDSKRAEIWDNQDKWLGKTIVIKSKSHGVKIKPRSPIYVGMRSEIDI